MKLNYRKSVAVILLAALAFQMPGSSTVGAMSKANKTAHKEYKKALADIKASFYSPEENETLPYAFIDVDGDKIDEMIIQPGFGFYTEGIYDYIGGKVVQTTSVGQGGFTKFYTTNKVIFIANSGHMGVLSDFYLKFNKKTKQYDYVAYVDKEYAQDDYDYSKPPVKVTYYVKDKKVSKATYTKYVKKLKKGSKVRGVSKLKWYEW